jgi:hypothetical protein
LSKRYMQHMICMEYRQRPSTAMKYQGISVKSLA